MTALSKIKAFIFEKMPAETVQRRIELTMALAETAATSTEKKALLKHAEEMTSVEVGYQELVTQLRRQS